jgi:hypothetical protein
MIGDAIDNALDPRPLPLADNQAVDQLETRLNNTLKLNLSTFQLHTATFQLKLQKEMYS